MPSLKVLRRKAQKKVKHRGYSRCSFCRGWCDIGLVGIDVYGKPLLFGASEPVDYAARKRCRECKREHILLWTGGGIGRHIPGGESH